MTDLELLRQERDYYRQQVKELGAKVVRHLEGQTRARREAARSRTIAMAQRATYGLADAGVPVAELGQHFAAAVAATLNVDKVVLLSHLPEASAFLVQHALGLPLPVGRRLSAVVAPPPFLAVSSKLPPDAFGCELLELLSARQLLWAHDPLSRLALLVANDSEDQAFHLPFTSDDRDLVEGALSVFATVARRRQIEAALEEANEQLALNMSDLERALEQAQEANRLKGEFLARMSHELRTPLNTIINVPHLLLRDYQRIPVWRCARCGDDYAADEGQLGDTAEMCPACRQPMQVSEAQAFAGDPANHVKFLERLHSSARHLRKLVDDLLDFSQIDAKKLKLHRTTVPVAALVQQLQDTMGPLAEDRAVAFVTPTLGSELVVAADFVKLTQVCINLIDNAMRFTPRGGTITLRVGEAGVGEARHVRFDVTDTGEGIPSDRLEDIFESFRQVDGSHTRKHGGVGLGLAICKSLVELHGGAIWATSTLGAGSTFSFTVPVAVPEACPSAPPLADATRKVVVVVEDSDVQLALFNLVLERAGFEPVLVQDPHDALARILATRPRCVVLDVMMPELSGISILKELKQRPDTCDIPVLVVTAHHSNESIVHKLGGLWLPKPWDSRDLVAAVQDPCQI